MTDYKYLASNIRFLRKLERLNQEKFGKKFGLTRGIIDSYERKIVVPDIPIQMRIAKEFKINLDILQNEDLVAHPEIIFQDAAINNTLQEVVKIKDELIAELKTQIKNQQQQIEQLTKALTKK